MRSEVRVADETKWRKALAAVVVAAASFGCGYLTRERVGAPVNVWTLNSGRQALVRVTGPAVLEELPAAAGMRIRSSWPLEVEDAPVAAVVTR